MEIFCMQTFRKIIIKMRVNENCYGRNYCYFGKMEDEGVKKMIREFEEAFCN